MSTPTSTRGPSVARRAAAVAVIGATAAAVAFALSAHLPSPTGSTAAAASGSSLSAVQLASWTGAPKALDASSTTGAAATAWCEDGLAADSSATPSVSDLDRRGSIASMVVSRGGYSSFCVADGSNRGMWEIVNEPGSTLPPVAATTIDLGSEDQHGTPSVSSAWGTAGADVKSVVLHADGRTVIASLDHGMWTAWWPGAAAPTAMQATVTTDRGASTTVALGDR
jgi:hypothetical protein